MICDYIFIISVVCFQPDEEEEEFRYLPDHEMDELKDQLADIERAREERRRK